jgi:predicted lipoprotein with Yx(FWY)xxD motif
MKHRLVVVAALAAALAPQAFAAHMGPVVTWQTKRFGPILATPGHLALYTWTKEKDGKVRCTGACAKAWPPLLVMKGEMVAKHEAGIMGTFGELRRPDGRMQVTFDKRPLYTYRGDSPTKILCNGMGGWYVVKSR